MMLPTDDQLDQISHADLVALVKALIAKVARLEEENRQLKAEIERLKQPVHSKKSILCVKTAHIDCAEANYHFEVAICIVPS